MGERQHGYMSFPCDLNSVSTRFVDPRKLGTVATPRKPDAYRLFAAFRLVIELKLLSQPRKFDSYQRIRVRIITGLAPKDLDAEHGFFQICASSRLRTGHRMPQQFNKTRRASEHHAFCDVLDVGGNSLLRSLYVSGPAPHCVRASSAAAK